MGREEPAALFYGVDMLVAVKAASTAFTILLIGGLAAPLAATLVPVVGPVWLIVVAAVAFGVSGSRVGRATAPALHGASAALSGYLLILPLVLWTPAPPPMTQLGQTALTAVVVGGLAGWVTSRRTAR